MYVTKVFNGLHVIKCLHCLKLLRHKVDENRLSVMINYRSGKIIRIVLNIVVTEWTTLFRRVRTEELSKNILQ